ncbi:response regulator [Tissierella pigra]|uniref:response regulator n=1 Tax=Tissierella pigra TaxID=2607614 RepID=UPI001C11E803|nr:response regulator [Tissierella pigra]MBU5427798.1 response regulator [Tissierella pigra]
MTKKRVVVVDDSYFSIVLIKDILEKNGFEVVGQASSLEEVISVVSDAKPDIITMDVTMPDTDGFQCTKEVYKIDKNIKVIMVSAMMDEEMLKKAKEHHVDAYVQKPIDEDNLILAINRIMEDKEQFKTFQNLYLPVFKEAFADALNKMTKTIPNFTDERLSNDLLKSKGISVVVGIIGKYSGRMILDMSIETATTLSSKALRRETNNSNEVMAVIGEFTNIVSGNACSILNRQNKVLGLRVSPPSIFSGDSLTVSSVKFKTFLVKINTDFGEMVLNIGFSDGDAQWM